MIRQAVTVLGAALVGALMMAPQAAADTGHQVTLDSGAVRCDLSADNPTFGTGPVAVCALTNGQPWGMAPFETSKWNQRLNLAVARGTGQFYWDRGDLPEPVSAPVTVDGGEYQVNGWAVQPEGLRTKLTYLPTGHGIYVNAGNIRKF